MTNKKELFEICQEYCRTYQVKDVCGTDDELEKHERNIINKLRNLTMRGY